MEPAWLRYFSAILIVLLFGWVIGIGLRLRSRGVHVAVFAKAKSNLLQRLLIAGALAVVVYAVLRAPFPAIDALVGAKAPLSSPAAALALLAGAALVAAAQVGMGRSWRIGVPETEGHVDRLVVTGLHRYSRNPVYLGIIVLLAGMVLAAPGPLTAAAIIVGFIGLTAIVRREERYLRERFGAEYEAYARRVRRWI